MSELKYNIPGTSFLTEYRVSVATDGGTWADHNFPCPVCHVNFAILNLDGWIFNPCKTCSEKGWRLSRRKTLIERLFG